MSGISHPRLPDYAVCRSVLADGRLLTITASRRARGNRADVKCHVAAAPALALRMQQVVRMARLTEALLDSRDQVLLSMDPAPNARERDWELAAVLADRMVRGLYAAAPGAEQALLALGWSDAWHLGRVEGEPLQAQRIAMAHLAPDGALVLGGQVRRDAGEPDLAGARCSVIGHLGALHGHADLADCVASVRSWFPLYCGGSHDSLAWLEVSVFPLAAGTVQASEEDSIAAPQLDPARLQALRQTLCAARHFDGHGLGRWRTLVRFSQPEFQGNSYELALVMADRMARGREFLPRGRLIATGQSSAWHAGLVEAVDGQQAKLALIARQAGAGDRILLPAGWAAALPAGYVAGLRQRGASLACIERIGMI